MDLSGQRSEDWNKYLPKEGVLTSEPNLSVLFQ